MTDNLNGKHVSYELSRKHREQDAEALRSMGRDVVAGVDNGSTSYPWLGASDRARTADEITLQAMRERIGYNGNGQIQPQEELTTEARESIRLIREYVNGRFQSNGQQNGAAER